MIQQKKNRQSDNASKLKRKSIEAVKIGIWGAIIWSCIGYLIYWFNFTKISPSHFSRPFIKSNLLFHWQGLLLTMVIIIGISILISLIYVFLFSHIYTPWIGIILGGAIWYLMLGWRKLEILTLTSTLSLFILYGAFIGYSLSLEFSSLEKSK